MKNMKLKKFMVLMIALGVLAGCGNSGIVHEEGKIYTWEEYNALEEQMYADSLEFLKKQEKKDTTESRKKAVEKAGLKQGDTITFTAEVLYGERLSLDGALLHFDSENEMEQDDEGFGVNNVKAMFIPKATNVKIQTTVNDYEDFNRFGGAYVIEPDVDDYVYQNNLTDIVPDSTDYQFVYGEVAEKIDCAMLASGEATLPSGYEAFFEDETFRQHMADSEQLLILKDGTETEVLCFVKILTIISFREDSVKEVEIEVGDMLGTVALSYECRNGFFLNAGCNYYTFE